MQWRLVFWITLAMFIITNLVFVAWASGEEQWWNKSVQESNKVTEEGSSTQNQVEELKV